MELFFIYIDYEEVHAETYKGVVLVAPDKEETRFESGDPIADFTAATAFARELGYRRDNKGKSLVYLSSTDHFVFDSLLYTMSDDSDGFRILRLRLITQQERVEWATDVLAQDKVEHSAWLSETISSAAKQIAWAQQMGLMTDHDAQELNGVLHNEEVEQAPTVEEILPNLTAEHVIEIVMDEEEHEDRSLHNEVRAIDATSDEGCFIAWPDVDVFTQVLNHLASDPGWRMTYELLPGDEENQWSIRSFYFARRM